MILYVAAPYRGDVAANIGRALQVAVALWRAGHVALCPHTMTEGFEKLAPEIPDETWLRGTRALLARCDGVVMGPGWQESEGSRSERELALYLGMPVWYWPEMPLCSREAAV